jgi:hypothetical protein
LFHDVGNREVRSLRELDCHAQVAFTHDAFEAIILNDWQVPDTLFPHEVEGVAKTQVGLDRVWIANHEVADISVLHNFPHSFVSGQKNLKTIPKQTIFIRRGMTPRPRSALDS